MNTNVDVDAMRKDAVEIFQKGFACSESVIYAIKKGFDLDLSDDAIAMSSGFPWGLGDGGCICGALAGATMCIGYFSEEEHLEMKPFEMPAADERVSRRI